MIYVVSGFMRSGTSMMMRALEAGGLVVAKEDERTKAMNERWGEVGTPNGYLPNDDYYEMLIEPHLNPRFPSEFEDKVVKVMYGGVAKLPRHQYRAIFMRRPARDIQMSMLAAFRDSTSLMWAPDVFDAHMSRIVDILRDRRSFASVDEVWYDDVIENPRKVFAKLDWPIDVDAAAAVPNGKKRRFHAA
jgi:hypothetical protein